MSTINFLLGGVVAVLAVKYLKKSGKNASAIENNTIENNILEASLFFNKLDFPYSPGTRESGFLTIYNKTNSILRLQRINISVADNQITQGGKELSDASQYVRVSIKNPDTLKFYEDSGSVNMSDSIVLTPGSIVIPVSVTITAYQPAGNPLLFSSDYEKNPMSLDMSVNIEGINTETNVDIKEIFDVSVPFTNIKK